VRALLIPGFLVVVGLVAACGDTPTAASDEVATPSQVAVQTAAPATPPPRSPAPSSVPLPATPEPVDTASPEPQGPGTAAACTGTDANRDFYASVADAVAWTVYCPVLPAGWFVDTGEYRLAGGGRMEIAYRGPGGARLELHEGAFCAEADGCAPSGTEVGQTAFGDLTATVVSADDGRWAALVAPGETISWLGIVSGTDEAAFRAIMADLVAVDG
jgi:hypothetical protein